MVCIYCKGPVGTSNSRAQKQTNQVWRRRKCKQCGAIFTTNEAADLSTAFVVCDTKGNLTPLLRDRLFLSILRNCQHRKTAILDAGSLTATVLADVTSQATEGRILNTDIITCTHSVLKHFDTAAAVQYAAYHPL